MRLYKRSIAAEATYFFTLNLQNRKSTLLIDHIDKIRFSFKKVQRNHPFTIDAIVILPDHLHFMMTLPKGDSDFSKRLNLIKGTFSRQIVPSESISLSRKKKRERGIWQRRFWEHLIRDDKDYEQHINYIHYNPVKHRYVSCPTQWPYSSIHRFIQKDVLPSNWAFHNHSLQVESLGK
jgi:putative transposase